MRGDGESGSIRVSVEKIDSLINLVGELVITQAMLGQLGEQLDPSRHERLQHALAQLEHNTRDLQESVMSIRMLPINFIFSRFPRLVRDTATRLGKQVELHLHGEHTELDKSVIEKLSDPLTHIVRNSIDHGIETPAERLAAGKPGERHGEARRQPPGRQCGGGGFRRRSRPVASTHPRQGPRAQPAGA